MDLGDKQRLDTLVFADLQLDEDTREVTRAGQTIELTATEYRLLRYLLLNLGDVLQQSGYWALPERRPARCPVRRRDDGPASWEGLPRHDGPPRRRAR